MLSNMYASDQRPKSRYLTVKGNYEGCLSNSDEAFETVRNAITPLLESSSCRIDKIECGFSGDNVDTTVTLHIISTMMKNLTTQEMFINATMSSLYHSLSKRSQVGFMPRLVSLFSMHYFKVIVHPNKHRN